MNPNREYTNKPGSMYPYNQNFTHERQTPRPLSPDEIQVWNSCLRESFYKCSIPFAVVMQLLNTYVFNKDAAKVSPSVSMFSARDVRRFAVNCFLGFLFYSPICFNKLKTKFFENEKKLNQLKQENILPAESGREASSDGDDYHMQSSLDPTMDGPAGSFSHLNIEFKQTFGDIDSERSDSHNQKKEKETKAPEVSYDDLRKQNRENFRKNFVLSSVQPYPQSSGQSNRPEPVAEKPPPSKPKNKYGDDME